MTQDMPERVLKRAMAALKAGIAMNPSSFQVYGNVDRVIKAIESVMHWERSKFAEVFQADSEAHGLKVCGVEIEATSHIAQ